MSPDGIFPGLNTYPICWPGHSGSSQASQDLSLADHPASSSSSLAAQRDRTNERASERERQRETEMGRERDFCSANEWSILSIPQFRSDVLPRLATTATSERTSERASERACTTDRCTYPAMDSPRLEHVGFRTVLFISCIRFVEDKVSLIKKGEKLFFNQSPLFISGNN